jgi:hypothetical protein
VADAQEQVIKTRVAGKTEDDVVGKAGADRKKAEADAETAAVAARFSESNAVQDSVKKGWEIKKLQNDITVNNANVAVAWAENAVNKAKGETQQLLANAQLTEAKEKRDMVVRERTNKLERGLNSVNEALNLITDLTSKDNKPALRGALGVTGVTAFVPGTPEWSVRNKLDRLKGLLAADNISVFAGTGPLSNADMQVIQSIGSSLSTFGNEKQSLSEIGRLKSMLQDKAPKLYKEHGFTPLSALPKAPTSDASGRRASGVTTSNWGAPQ